MVGGNWMLDRRIVYELRFGQGLAEGCLQHIANLEMQDLNQICLDQIAHMYMYSLGDKI
jgi:hypothetical protein